jgi:hypothetical protein
MHFHCISGAKIEMGTGNNRVRYFLSRYRGNVHSGQPTGRDYAAKAIVREQKRERGNGKYALRGLLSSERPAVVTGLL